MHMALALPQMILRTSWQPMIRYWMVLVTLHLIIRASPQFRKRGDANGDTAINVNDIIYLKRNLLNPALPPYADCNGDGVVNVNDIIWLN